MGPKGAHYAPTMRPLCAHYAPTTCINRFGVQPRAQRAPPMRPLSAHSLHEPFRGGTDEGRSAPAMRPLCAHFVPTMSRTVLELNREAQRAPTMRPLSR